MSRVASPAVPATGAAIEAVELVKRFGSFDAVRGISFEVPRGQVCALLGPNGAGKTTTIHLLLGLTIPTSGSARVLGHDVSHDRSAAIQRTNFMASYVQLPNRITVTEALRVCAALYGVADPKRAVAEVIELLELGSFARKPFSTLSSGQQTLVCLGKALVNDPELLFLDEPTASLDPERAFEARRVLRHVADERGTTIFITSHNMVEIERLADRILILSGGTIVADATAAQLRTDYGVDNLEDVFLQVARKGREQ